MRNHEQVRSPKGWSPFHKAPASRLEGKAWDLGKDPSWWCHIGRLRHQQSGHWCHTGWLWPARPTIVRARRRGALGFLAKNGLMWTTTPPSETTAGCLRFPPTPMGNAHAQPPSIGPIPARGRCCGSEQACCISPKMSTMDSCTGLCPRSKVTCLPASCRRWRFKTRLARIFATGIKTLQDLPRHRRQSAVEWVDLLDTHAPRGDLRIRGYDNHARGTFCPW